MAEKINDGGPAFPTENARQTGANSWHYEGMTLREYYAGEAMKGLLAGDWFGSLDYGAISSSAVKQADALLAALKEEA